MSETDSNEIIDLKEDMITKIEEKKISSKVLEEEILKESRSIADCNDSLQKQEIEKLIARSDNNKQLFRKLAMFSKNMKSIIQDIEMLKKRIIVIPAGPIPTYASKYRVLTKEMENLTSIRSTMSIEKRRQDLIYHQKKKSAKVHDTLKKNHISRAIIRTGNWKGEIKLLQSLLQQPRKQGQIIDIKDNLRHKRIQDLQKRIDSFK